MHLLCILYFYVGSLDIVLQRSRPSLYPMEGGAVLKWPPYHFHPDKPRDAILIADTYETLVEGLISPVPQDLVRHVSHIVCQIQNTVGKLSVL